MEKIRNIAIIAHVDHGKTTLVNKLLDVCSDQDDRDEVIMDNIDLERVRGITIVSKNVSIRYNGYKINIIDTPGHADFGGEVERVLNMADGVLLIVDAQEGPMPQTRYVLSKAIMLGKKPLVVINKVDKESSRPEEVQEEVFELMFQLDADEDQLDFETLYGSARDGWMSTDWRNPTTDMTALLEMVLETIPAPHTEPGSLQLQITSIDYSDYIGRIAIGRVTRGTLLPNTPVTLIKRDGKHVKSRTKEIFTFRGMAKEKAASVEAGDLCAISGIEGFDIGDVISDFESPEGMPAITIDEPTMSMLFTVNDSPFFGREGKFVTSRHIRERLYAETEKNLALKIEDTRSPDSFEVHGRGVMHLSVLIETMRREGYELQVGKPNVLFKEIDGVKNEPIEQLIIDTPESSSGKLIEAVSQRKGELLVMEPKGDIMHLEFEIPSRGIIGLRTLVMNLSSGEAVMAHRFSHYSPHKGDIPTRNKGSLIVSEGGTTIPYAMDRLQDRGLFFVGPGAEVYEGQIVGENNREDDLVVNVTRTKKLTNIRAAGSDDKVKLAPPLDFSLEQYMEYLKEDEYLEVTPENLRLRKIFLKEHERKRQSHT